MGKNELSHEQVWDDSALIQSWDDALEEYKLYHSIHARGEKVEDVLKKVQMQSDESQPEVREGQYDHEQSPDGFKEESEMDVEVRIQQREAVAQNAASHSTQVFITNPTLISQLINILQDGIIVSAVATIRQ
ncbi:MAG: hypothetical protein M1827_002888 [Pycnora praestabilis]|nr:MAG: hypothetical protein M1827_002888 [Pycnora praestabilis]